jgi:hypothetical protein
MGLLPAILPIKAAFSAISTLAHAARPAHGRFAAHLRDSVEARFMARFDADKNGTVTPGEFPGSRGVFGQWDRDGDGAVTIGEAHLALTRISESARARAAAQAGWDLRDADRNGLLTCAESGLSKSEWSAIDTDADGMLGHREWIAVRGTNEGR